MASLKRRYPKEEFARRGDAMFEKDILPQLKTGDKGKFVAVDIDSGEYEISADEFEASEKLSSRLPSAQIWLVKVGSRYTHRFGGRDSRNES